MGDKNVDEKLEQLLLLVQHLEKEIEIQKKNLDLFLFSPKCRQKTVHVSFDKKVIKKIDHSHQHDVVTTGVPLPSTGVHCWYIRINSLMRDGNIFIGVIADDGAEGLSGTPHDGLTGIQINGTGKVYSNNNNHKIEEQGERGEWKDGSVVGVEVDMNRRRVRFEVDCRIGGQHEEYVLPQDVPLFFAASLYTAEQSIEVIADRCYCALTQNSEIYYPPHPHSSQ